MRKMILGCIASLLMVVGLTVATSVPANAALQDPCSSMRLNKISHWYNDVSFQDPEAVRLDGTMMYAPIRLVANMGYTYCPNGIWPAKIRARYIDWCYTLLDWRPGLFDGVKYNAYHFDDGSQHVVNPPEVKVADGGMQNCYTQDIDGADERWMRVGDHPKWSASIWVVMQGWPDSHFDLQAGGDSLRNIDPSNDITIGDWY